MWTVVSELMQFYWEVVRIVVNVALSALHLVVDESNAWGNDKLLQKLYPTYGPLMDGTRAHAYLDLALNTTVEDVLGNIYGTWLPGLRVAGNVTRAALGAAWVGYDVLVGIVLARSAPEPMDPIMPWMSACHMMSPPPPDPPTTPPNPPSPRPPPPNPPNPAQPPVPSGNQKSNPPPPRRRRPRRRPHRPPWRRRCRRRRRPPWAHRSTGTRSQRDCHLPCRRLLRRSRRSRLLHGSDHRARRDAPRLV